MIHITLGQKGSRDADDPQGRTFHGWAPEVSTEENWQANRGDWVLGARAERENYVIFSHRGQVVMAAEIDQIVDAPNRPGRKMIEGRLLGKGHPVHDTYVDQDTPERVRGSRNPVTYLDSTVGGRLCECGCAQEIYSGRFVRGHEQTALHQRVAKIGTIQDFLDWFDAVQAKAQPAASERTPITVNREGRLALTVTEDGRVTLFFTPAAA